MPWKIRHENESSLTQPAGACTVRLKVRALCTCMHVRSPEDFTHFKRILGGKNV